MARLMISSQNLRASWKPVNPQDCEWKNFYRIIMRTISQEEGTIHCSITIWYTNFPMPQAMKIPAAKAAVDKEREELGKIPEWNLTKVRCKSEVIDEARTKGAKVHFASLMEFVADFGASMLMISKKDLNSAELETVTTSTNPTTVITANGEVQTHDVTSIF